jgi:hypothetical protein
MKPRTKPALFVATEPLSKAATAIVFRSDDETNVEPAPNTKPLTADRRLIFDVTVALVCIICHWGQFLRYLSEECNLIVMTPQSISDSVHDTARLW